MAGILVWFWNERFWLPHNVTWADLKNTDDATFPQAEDLYVAIPLAFCIFMIRLFFERFIARPCALALKIQANGPQKAQHNAILEKVFTAITKHPDEKRLEGLSKQLDWDVRSIQRWFRQRRNQEKPSTLTRFCESMWKFTFNLYIFTYGIRYLKKDFGIMFLHHLATISLITFSYVNNMVRVGTLVMCLHDMADVLLEAAKMANYSKCQKLCDLLFVVFALVFVIARLGIFPLWILNTTMFESWEIVGPYPSWWVFNLLLLVLQSLHLFWSYLIIKIACKAISKGKVSKDDRSDIESSSEDEDSPPRVLKPHTSSTNGVNSTKGINGYFMAGTSSDEH
uniref:Ceramide synthase 6 n=1 Tax=Pyxicephalus adspersus TaxID=30357 RepID=A0AAV2ZZS3_PYXAD|nr:TPA: hypothetical protein GDO54_015574 [Pyxicephalus adspersus]